MQNRTYTFGQSIPQHGETMPKVKERVSEFGERLTTLRKAAGYTQVELAAAIGTTQRMVAYYESRAEKAPAALLPQMAEVLGISSDALLGIAQPRKPKAPDTRLQRRLRQIEKMGGKERRQVLQVLDTFIEHARFQQQANG